MRDPNSKNGWNSNPIRITARKEGWFYHRAVHVKLPGGHDGILTARAKKPLIGNRNFFFSHDCVPNSRDDVIPKGNGQGELVWISIPKNVSSLWSEGGNDDALRLQETVLLQGPDVMFEVIDIDDSDQSIEIVAAHFFGRRLSVHSLQASATFPFVEITHSSSIETSGRPYGICLANLDPTASGAAPSPLASSSSSSSSPFRNSRQQQNPFVKARRKSSLSSNYNSAVASSGAEENIDESRPTHILVTTHECSYDLPSAVNMAFSAMGGNYPIVKISNRQSSAPPSAASSFEESAPDVMAIEAESLGGSLYAYKLPEIKRKSKIRPTTFFKDKKLQKSDSPVSSASPTPLPLDESSLRPTQPAALSNSHISAWERSTLHRGFKVRGWGGIFSPGAPGFPYVFRMPGSVQVFASLLIYALTVLWIILIFIDDLPVSTSHPRGGGLHWLRVHLHSVAQELRGA